MVLACAIASAQNITDVLQYSRENLQGTARFQAMGGAFGALGGDLSALNTNPAGSAVFNTNFFTISATHYNRDNDTRYENIVSGTKASTTDINQAGGVFIYKKANDNSYWKKIALAFNYDVVQNFNNSFTASGRSNQGIDTYFSNFAQGVPLGDIRLQDNEYIEEAYLDIGANFGFGDQQAFLGYFGGILDPSEDTNANTSYISNTKYTTVDHHFLEKTSGYNSKFTANIAAQYQDNLYVGASLNFHTIVYEKLTEFTESGYDADSRIKRTIFDNLLHTEGTGFSLNLGLIAKLNNNVRIGGSYQSPTWYRLQDETSQRINSDLADDDISFINFDVVNVFETHTIKTPAKLTGSIAIIFGKDGLLSFDYDYQDMSKAELRPTSDSSFSNVNKTILNELGTVSTFRLGGEYRIDNVSLRGGYTFKQSPYVNGNTIGELTGYSAGVGYSFGPNRIDLSLNRIEQDVDKQLFDTGIITPAKINARNTNITLSYSINL